MQQTDYVKIHNILDAKPTDPSSKVLIAESFAAAIDEFLSENFNGSLKVTNNAKTTELILVTPDYAAYLLKSLLCFIYGRTFLTFEIRAEESGLVIDISAEDDLPLADAQLRQIIKIARNAQMDINISHRKITLTIKYTEGTKFRVYAIAFADGKHRMLFALNEIFFCGKRYTTVEKNENSNDTDKRET